MKRIYSVALSHNDTFFVSRCEENNIQVYSYSTGEIIKFLTINYPEIHDITLTLNNKFLRFMVDLRILLLYWIWKIKLQIKQLIGHTLWVIKLVITDNWTKSAFILVLLIIRSKYGISKMERILKRSFMTILFGL